MEEENKNLEAEEPTEVLGNTGVIEPVVEEPVPAPVVETSAEPVAETPAPEAVQVEETPVVETPVVEEPASTSVSEVPAEPVQETPVEQPTVEPAPVAPTPEEPKKEEKKGSNKLLIIVALLVLVLGGGYAVWAYVLGGNKPAEQPKEKEEQKEEQKEEEKPEEKEEEKKPEEEKEEQKEKYDTKTEVAIDDEIKEVYNKYHNFEDGSIKNKLYGSIESTIIHGTQQYELKNTNEIEKHYAKKIYDAAKDELEQFAKEDNSDSSKSGKYVSASDGREIIKKHFDEFFGHIIEYSDEYLTHKMTCNYLQYYKDEDVFYLDTNKYCGDNPITQITYSIKKAEKEKDNLYISEEILVYFPGEETKTVNTLWTYQKQSDNKYYFVKVEKI